MEGVQVVRFEVACSKGTYIRSLVFDLVILSLLSSLPPCTLSSMPAVLGSRGCDGRFKASIPNAPALRGFRSGILGGGGLPLQRLMVGNWVGTYTGMPIPTCCLHV